MAITFFEPFFDVGHISVGHAPGSAVLQCQQHRTKALAHARGSPEFMSTRLSSKLAGNTQNTATPEQFANAQNARGRNSALRFGPDPLRAVTSTQLSSLRWTCT